MAPHILLINPWIHDVAAYDLWIKPVGLLVIGEQLRRYGIKASLIDCLDYAHPAMEQTERPHHPKRKHDGRGHFHKTKIECPEVLRQLNVPFRRYGISPEALRAAIAEQPEPDAVFVGSMMTYWYTGVIETIAHIRQCLPKVPVYLGGVYATLCPEHARRQSTADRVFTGAFTPALLNEMGLGSIESNPASSAGFAMPDCSLLGTLSSIPLLTSRGCPNRCPYCASHRLYAGFKQCDPEDIVRIVYDRHTRTGVRDFALYDDALLVDTQKHFIPLARGLAALKLPIRLHVPNGLHVRYITDEIAHLLKATGCATLRLGFESADEGLQKDTGGKVNNDDYVRAVKALQQAGFTRDQVGVYILAGLPGQTAKQVAHSIAFVHQTGFRPFISEYSPIPGTAMWEAAVQASPFPIVDEPLFHNNSLLPCRSKDCTPENVHMLKRFARNPDEKYLC
jgi:hypothetical protein